MTKFGQWQRSKQTHDSQAANENAREREREREGGSEGGKERGRERERTLLHKDLKNNYG